MVMGVVPVFRGGDGGRLAHVRGGVVGMGLDVDELAVFGADGVSDQRVMQRRPELRAGELQQQESGKQAKPGPDSGSWFHGFGA